jgi:phosphatidylethanolamine/phosphatidyl-N-methylethanolamine N-methyltransferase
MAIPLRQIEQFGVGHREAAARSVALVGRLYSAITPFYDFMFGPLLQPGRRTAIERMALRPGSRVLEVGVGTALDASLYPHDCDVVGIDVSSGMLDKARERLQREHLRHVRVMRMDAANLTFADGSFDIVYAPYTISTVPDPVRVAREMRRVCRAEGRVFFLNHFLSRNPWVASVERNLTGITQRVGFRSNLDLSVLLDDGGLEPVSIERVNVPPIWSLVICRPASRH